MQTASTYQSHFCSSMTKHQTTKQLFALKYYLSKEGSLQIN